MALTVDVIKRGKKRRYEPFQRQKLYDSIVATCRILRVPEGQADIIADTVCEQVIDWLANRYEVTSQDLRTQAGRHLNKQHPEAAYLYEQYHVTI